REGTGIGALSGTSWFPTLLGMAALLTHLTAAGAMLFYGMALRPVQRRLGLFGPAAQEAHPSHSAGVHPAVSTGTAPETGSLALRGAIAALLSFLFRLPEPWFQASSLTGLPWTSLLWDPLVTRIVTDTRFGQIWLLRQGGALVLTALLVQLALRARRGPGLWLPLSVATSLLPAVLPAWGGHAATHGPLA